MAIFAVQYTCMSPKDVWLIPTFNLYSPILHAHTYYSSLFLDAQNGKTPLMAAVHKNCLEAMEVLLTECNCNINARDEVRCSVQNSLVWLPHLAIVYCIIILMSALVNDSKPHDPLQLVQSLPLASSWPGSKGCVCLGLMYNKYNELIE